MTKDRLQEVKGTESAVFQNMAREMCSHLNTLILWGFVRLFHFKKTKKLFSQSVIVFLFVCGHYVSTGFFWARQFILSLNVHPCLHVHVLFGL